MSVNIFLFIVGLIVSLILFFYGISLKKELNYKSFLILACLLFSVNLVLFIYFNFFF